MRIARRFIGLLFGLFTVLTILAVGAAWLALSGTSPTLLAETVRLAGKAFSGQQVEDLRLTARLEPEEGLLHARAQVVVAVQKGPRRFVYLLLNRALDLDAVQIETADGGRAKADWTRIAEVIAVRLPAPAPAGGKVRLSLTYSGRPDGGAGAVAGARIGPAGVVLPPAALWYPTDVQGFWFADVSLAVPAGLQVLHGGSEVFRRRLGALNVVRWNTARPVAGIGVVVGRYRVTTEERESRRYTVAVPSDSELDMERLRDALYGAHRSMRRRYGPSGFAAMVLVIDNAPAGKSFFDGSGVSVVSQASLAGGDFGFRAIAHGVSHAWWGGTVGAAWLEPGAGGEWLLEGLSELSALLAVRDRFGERAWLRAWQKMAFDPSRTGPPATGSFLQEALSGEPDQALRRRAAWAWRLALEALGEDRFAAALRELADAARQKVITPDGVWPVLEKNGGKAAARLLRVWGTSEVMLDLSLDPREGGADVRNHGNGPIPDKAVLWRLLPDEEPEREMVAVGGRVLLGNVERLILDPQFLLPDMRRDNNILPRRSIPRSISVAPGGSVLLVEGGPFPWSAAKVVLTDAQGNRLREWAFDRGLVSEPTWSADGTRILAVEETAAEEFRAWELHPSDGSRRSLGEARQVAGLPDGTVVAQGEVLAVTQGGVETRRLRVPGARLERLLAAPTGSAAAVIARRTSGFDLIYADLDSGEQRILLRTRVRPGPWMWSAGGQFIDVAVSADDGWRIYRLPLGGEPEILVSEAAWIGDLSISPDGHAVAFPALAGVEDYPGRTRLFIADAASGRLDSIGLGGREPHSVAWIDDETLLVIASDPTDAIFPPQAELFRVDVNNGDVTRFGAGREAEPSS